MIVEKLNMTKVHRTPAVQCCNKLCEQEQRTLNREPNSTPWLLVVDTKYNIHVTILEKDNVFDIDVESH